MIKYIVLAIIICGIFIAGWFFYKKNEKAAKEWSADAQLASVESVVIPFMEGLIIDNEPQYKQYIHSESKDRLYKILKDKQDEYMYSNLDNMQKGYGSLNFSADNGYTFDYESVLVYKDGKGSLLKVFLKKELDEWKIYNFSIENL